MNSNNTQFFFIRHGQLVEPYLNHLAMDYSTLSDLATSALDPGINKNAIDLFNSQTSGVDFSAVSRIYYNNSGIQSRRSLESAKIMAEFFLRRYKKELTPVGLSELKEVRFDVRQLVSEDDFKKNGMPAIRTALYDSFVNGGSTESIVELDKRIDVIKDVIINHVNKKESVLFVTHDFFMRVLEVYIKRFNQLRGVTVDDFEKTSLNSYFSGFFTTAELSSLTRWGSDIFR
ncbi:MAG: hypothetical protein HY973_03755 [Candidatus Kerfeldbacteria bacterium]|nr:hypothetical protein [Candidatus Kerfeldbacteria bacterium]